MPDDRDELALAYLHDVFRRGSAPMAEGFEPNWIDRPWRYKTYADAPGFRLPRRWLDSPATAGSHPAWDLQALSATLLASVGLISRRLAITANDDAPVLAQHTWALWGRGAASGGGLYPIETYVVCGSSFPGYPAGVYHYDIPAHALRLVRRGNWITQIKQSTPVEGLSSIFVVHTGKFWKSAFKYNELAYHEVSLDHGTILEMWRSVAAELGRPAPEFLFHFDVAAVDRLLGNDSALETAFSVVPLPSERHPSEQAGSIPDVVGPPARREAERSRTVRRFPQLEAVNAAVRASATSAPHQVGPAPAVATESAVPHGELSTAVRARRTSFGRFDAASTLSTDDLMELLRATSADDSRGGGCRLVVLVNRVEDMSPGFYTFDRGTTSLTFRAGPPDAAELQQTYFLRNYNVDHPAATILLVSSARRAVADHGALGIRILCSEVGAAAQRLYLSAASQKIGCGVVLGFDNVAVQQLAALPDDDWPILVGFVGREHQPSGDYRFELIPQSPEKE